MCNVCFHMSLVKLLSLVDFLKIYYCFYFNIEYTYTVLYLFVSIFKPDVHTLLTVACMEGEYKHLQGVDDKCIVCPENSNSTDVGALSCDCLDGYYRAENEGVDTECTGEYTIYLQ